MAYLNNKWQLKDDRIIENEHGFYQLKDKPTKEELDLYYSNAYFQDGNKYSLVYNEKEIEYFNNKVEQFYKIIKDNQPQKKDRFSKFLDIGSGEGWSLSYFDSRGWQVTGLDYSEYACGKFNPHVVDKMIFGDLEENIKMLIQQNEKYDCIFLMSVLEHVLDPEKLLKKCKKLLSENGILAIKVPNDFSILQKKLIEEKEVDNKYWIAIPDHISYFDSEGLRKLFGVLSYKELCHITNFPTDLLLLSENSNFINYPEKGKVAHYLRVDIENLLHEISPELTNELYEQLAKLGLGRDLIFFLKNDVNE